MDPQLVILLVGIGAPFITTLGGYAIATRAAKKNEETSDKKHREDDDKPVTVPPAPSPPPSAGLSPDAKFDEAQTWYEVIQHFVDDAVRDATKPLKDQIAQSVQRDRIVSRFVQRLYWWDESGRRGPMPRLTYEEQKALDLDLVPEDTGGRPDRWAPPPAPERYD